MSLPIESLLPVASAIVPLLVEKYEDLTCPSVIDELSTILPEDMYLLIRKISKVEVTKSTCKSSHLNGLYEAVELEDYSLLIQRASKIDVLFAALLAKILMASGQMLGLETMYAVFS